MSEFGIQPISIEQEIKKSYLEYSLSVIIGRAIPDVRDGLKPVHRRILFGMHELSNTWNRPHLKSARVVGDVMGKYHPHGDAAIYDALVRMAQPFSMRDVLVDGQGNFGSIDGDSPAAQRYTEVRMAKLASEMLADLDKETVDFRPNYDDSEKEPVVLPAKVPNLLLNGSSGIAVGMATNIPPHNLGELCDGVLHLLDDPDCSIVDLMQHIKGPDFPTAGQVFAGQGLYDAYCTGRGSVRVRGVIRQEERKKGFESLVITELPFAVNKTSLVEKIASLVNDKKIEGVSDLRDESNRKGIRVVLDLKKGAMPEIIINALFKYTPLESSFGVNMLAVVDNRPKLLNLKDVLRHFLSHRREVVIRRTRYELRKAEDRAHILEGLRIAIDNIDEIIELIRTSANPPDAKARLIERFVLSEVQAQAILSMQLQRLTGLEVEKIIEEYEELLKRIQYLKSILESPEVLKGVIRAEVEEVRQLYVTPRKSEILPDDLSEFVIEDLIPDDEVILTLSRRGYIKRTTLDNYRVQGRGGKGVAAVQTSDGDFIHTFCATSNHQTLLLFSNKGRMYSVKVHQVPEGSRTAKGMHIANLLPLEREEWIATALTMREFVETRALLFVTRKGVVKRSEATLYSNVRRAGIIALNLREDDELIMVREVGDTDECVLTTQKGLAIRFPVNEVRLMGRASAGVKGMTLASNDDVVAGVILKAGNGVQEILSISSNGYGKRTLIEHYRLQSRGGKGVINMKVTSKTGDVIGAMPVSESDELILLTTANKAIRTSVREISLVGRATQGVRIVRMDEKDSVAAFDLVRETLTDACQV
ncbi:DNA gyrase subunit A [Megalodesulfovibrio gigas]|uniref:DNA gyrase subunit A n=1 Tax=Megalodesulfovibrio gigas (strain ATCC 19364 / DSM 1382 / NCIMB 9332 / VKM B-1759) TaxID=1121448 RepID=T2GA48_MEGG1|nr:DNA gyrase subunit A [Megalodesulfovibrio gigas]AGW13001.1 putative DNA gyrase subunit A [Megalodesulfovibrio gigas DSM 1382 = ATCC 19364]